MKHFWAAALYQAVQGQGHPNTTVLNPRLYYFEELFNNVHLRREISADLQGKHKAWLLNIKKSGKDIQLVTQQEANWNWNYQYPKSTCDIYQSTDICYTFDSEEKA